MRDAVRSVLPFLAFLMLALAGFSGMAHAAGLAGVGVSGVTFTIHAAGDVDDLPSDADKGAPQHHHYCHGHEVGQPAKTEIGYTHVVKAPNPMASRVKSLTGRDGPGHLRPPQA